MNLSLPSLVFNSQKLASEAKWERLSHDRAMTTSKKDHHLSIRFFSQRVSIIHPHRHSNPNPKSNNPPHCLHNAKTLPDGIYPLGNVNNMAMPIQAVSVQACSLLPVLPNLKSQTMVEHAFLSILCYSPICVTSTCRLKP